MCVTNLSGCLVTMLFMDTFESYVIFPPLNDTKDFNIYILKITNMFIFRSAISYYIHIGPFGSTIWVVIFYINYWKLLTTHKKNFYKSLEYSSAV